MQVVCYNYMPQVSDDAMVVRTSFRTPTRGGALISSFNIDDLEGGFLLRRSEMPTTDEQMWDHLEYFLKRVVPAAEAAEVKLAMHPDEPPLSPICNLARIMRSVESFDRLFAIAPSPVNGITLCQGWFAELGCNLPEAIRHFADRIHSFTCATLWAR